MNLPLQAYSTALLASIGVILVTMGLADRRRDWLLTCSLPFIMTGCASALRIDPALLPGSWGLQFGAAFLLGAHASGWQAVRRFQKRPGGTAWAIGLPLAWLVFSIGAVESLEMPVGSAAAHALVTAAFSGLSAWELAGERSEDLPSRAFLRGIFMIHVAMAALQVPLSAFLPVPLGGLPITNWAVLAFNILAAIHLMLATALLILLSRERAVLHSQRLSMRDPLTDTFNRRAYDQDLQLLSEDPAQALTLLVFDIDRFKSINDRFGHAFGDKVIQLAARVAASALRETDSLYRVGGEEFVCLLRNTSGEAGLQIAERLRSAFEFAGRRLDGVQMGATLSVGVASSGNGPVGFDRLFAEADAALYAAKNGGRNRAVLAGPLTRAA
ncbi:GGDEF domain-containing protein [Roseomonas xinghualingensis]|uniref:GGDEF domain-containing protein n=1 Tax=Roseomonas xinghualingensis TaxID=2986475 RepID=UPI0021F172C4|nr:GGDEF domain-containing protein [Roseomonas sp. SXEYE001]MCV4207010.1 GGDEF domain-containing protein [Roseomonas sp. SXEYE001]